MHPQIERLNVLLDKFRARVQAHDKIDGMDFAQSMIEMLSATLLTLESMDARITLQEEATGGPGLDTGRSR